MRFLTTIAAGSILLATTAAAGPPKVPPRLYRVDGRPVPVSCLEGLAAQDDDAAKSPIDLRTCGNPKPRPKVQADGSIGYDISDGGYFYYSYVGQSDGIDILALQSSGGGTGRFTQLVGVKHSGNFLTPARDYAGGDRCNGGVSAERVLNGKLMFDQAITPYDLIRLAQPKMQLEAYKDLEASAASCVGTVHMVGDTTHWTGVSLDEPDWMNRKDWTEDYRYQACFNKLYRRTLSGVSIEMNREGVLAFAQQFVARCVRPH